MIPDYINVASYSFMPFLVTKRSELRTLHCGLKFIITCDYLAIDYGVDMTAEEPARVSKARVPALAEGREERCHR